MSDQLSCLEQSAGQLCFNKRYEKVAYWMSHPHHRMPTRCYANIYRFASPNRNDSSYAHPCYRNTSTYPHP
jgi:hypothetical protein